MTDIRKMKKDELIELANDLGIKTDEKMTKKDILEILEELENKEIREATEEEASLMEGELSREKEKHEEKIEEKHEEKPNVDILTERMSARRTRISKSSGRRARSGAILRVDGPDRMRKLKTKEQRDEWDLEASMDENMQKILTGVVGTISPPYKWNGEVHMFANVMHGTQLVKIPGEYFLPDWDTLTNWQKDIYLNQRIGQEVDFIAFGWKYIDGRKVWYASRKDAQKKLQSKKWFQKDSKGRYLINEGDIIEGKVNAVTVASCFIEAFGVEDRVRSGELTYEYLLDANDKFHQRDRILVKVLEIDRTGGEVKAKFSVKQVEENPVLRFAEEVDRGERAFGIVTRVLPTDKGLAAFVYVPDRGTVRCTMARGVDKIPSQGDSVHLVIMGSSISKEEKMAYIWGKIVHVDTKSDIRW